MTTVQIQAPHYRKTKDGTWVVAGPAATIVAGRQVTVTKRNGETKTETIERVGKTYDDHGVQCRYGYIAARHSRNEVRESGKRCWETGANCYSHGSVYCEECGDHMYQ